MSGASTCSMPCVDGQTLQHNRQLKSDDAMSDTLGSCRNCKVQRYHVVLLFPVRAPPRLSWPGQSRTSFVAAVFIFD